jgi:hypothetical protein
MIHDRDTFDADAPLVRLGQGDQQHDIAPEQLVADPFTAKDWIIAGSVFIFLVALLVTIALAVR